MKSFGSSPKILNVVIDEIDEVIDEQVDNKGAQDALDALEDELSMRSFLKTVHHKAKSHQRVVKNYHFSPQAFQIETNLN